ncbi:response regulator [Coleofasciculus sp.]|uniref:response regulator n=1 Tax=Coleofasciculus sp. TaxID=3100458 RepID=UPI003A33B200
MSGKPSNILLVEDDDNDVFLIQRAFRRLNLPHSLQVVTNGEEAISYLNSKAPYNDLKRYPIPALILLDLKLPRKSGLEVLAWIRQQPQLKRLLVVVLTASKETPDINKAYDLGANSYLVKPVNFHNFLEMIRTLDLYWLMFNEKPMV